nr:unnamed protein product [Leishmania braziliensis]
MGARTSPSGAGAAQAHPSCTSFGRTVTRLAWMLAGLVPAISDAAYASWIARIALLWKRGPSSPPARSTPRARHQQVRARRGPADRAGARAASVVRDMAVA